MWAVALRGGGSENPVDDMIAFFPIKRRKEAEDLTRRTPGATLHPAASETTGQLAYFEWSVFEELPLEEQK